jgi:hypothetical protein
MDPSSASSASTLSACTEVATTACSHAKAAVRTAGKLLCISPSSCGIVDSRLVASLGGVTRRVTSSADAIVFAMALERGRTGGSLSRWPTMREVHVFVRAEQLCRNALLVVHKS